MKEDSPGSHKDIGSKGNGRRRRSGASAAIRNVNYGLFVRRIVAERDVPVRASSVGSTVKMSSERCFDSHHRASNRPSSVANSRRPVSSSVFGGDTGSEGDDFGVRGLLSTNVSTKKARLGTQPNRASTQKNAVSTTTARRRSAVGFYDRAACGGHGRRVAVGPAVLGRGCTPG